MSLKSDITFLIFWSKLYLFYHKISLFVWQNRKGFPLLVSGVPPDAFSETGQLWGRFEVNTMINIFLIYLDFPCFLFNSHPDSLSASVVMIKRHLL